MTQANMQGEYIAKQNEEKELKEAARQAFQANTENTNPDDDKPMP